MAFPVIESSVAGNSGASSTTHVITLPTGIVDGDLVLLFFNNDGAQTASITTPGSGWNGPFGHDVSAGNNNRLFMFYRWADGAEAATITMTVTSTEAAAWTAYRISGADPGIDPEISAGATGASASPNPDTLTASWGSNENLWFAFYGWDGDHSHVSYPTGYSNELTSRWANVAGVGIASAALFSVDATEDPGAAAIGSSDEWVAYTVAVRSLFVTNGIYRTVLDADAYFAGQLWATDWTGATQSDKERALLAATRAVDSLVYAGYKKTVYDLLAADEDATAEEILAAYESQEHQFPRNTQPVDTVPDDVFWAVCEEAKALLSGRDPEQEFRNLELTSDGVGSNRVTMDRSGVWPEHSAHLITSPLAWKYLQRYLDKNNTFRIIRS